MSAINREYPDHTIEVVLAHPGRAVTYAGLNGSVTARLERVFEVILDGDPVGTVTHSLVNRAQCTPDQRYVNKRWKTPAWVPQGAPTRSADYPSRIQAVRALIDSALEQPVGAK